MLLANIKWTQSQLITKKQPPRHIYTSKCFLHYYLLCESLELYRFTMVFRSLSVGRKITSITAVVAPSCVLFYYGFPLYFPGNIVWLQLCNFWQSYVIAVVFFHSLLCVQLPEITYHVWFFVVTVFSNVPDNFLC